mmetsp:Transcript_84524/g.262467  ORF Transcript_84524/g.262467 Transcript_84524/m.262467 type:complete len:298 (-) Transcript_84524:1008-1901(-)
MKSNCASSLPLSGLMLRQQKYSAQLFSPSPCIMLRICSCSISTSRGLGMPLRSSYSSHRRSMLFFLGPPLILSATMEATVSVSPYFLKTMFLRNQTLKQSKRMDTMPALKDFSKRTSGLTPCPTRTGNLSMAQLAFRSRVSFRIAVDTSSQVYFLETARRHRNSPMLGQAFFTRASSLRRKVPIFRSTCSCSLGYWRRIERSRWWKPMYPSSALVDRWRSPFISCTVCKFISFGSTSRPKATSPSVRPAAGFRTGSVGAAAAAASSPSSRTRSGGGASVRAGGGAATLAFCAARAFL